MSTSYYWPRTFRILSLGTLKINSSSQFDEPDWTGALKMYSSREMKYLIGWLEEDHEDADPESETSPFRSKF